MLAPSPNSRSSAANRREHNLGEEIARLVAAEHAFLTLKSGALDGIHGVSTKV